MKAAFPGAAPEEPSVSLRSFSSRAKLRDLLLLFPPMVPSAPSLQVWLGWDSADTAYKVFLLFCSEASTRGKDPPFRNGRERMGQKF